MSEENNYSFMTEETIPRPVGRVKAMLIPKLKMGLIDIIVFICIFSSILAIGFVSFENNWIKLVFGLVGGITAAIFIIGEPGRRVYNNFYKFIIFLVSKKKYVGNNIDKLLPYSFIENKYIKAKNGKWISILRIKGNNIVNMKEGQQEHLIRQFQNLLIGLNTSVFITKLDTPFETDTHSENIINLLDKYAKDKIKTPLLEHNLGVTTVLGDENNSAATYYFLLSNQNKTSLEEDIQNLKNLFQQSSLKCERLYNDKLFRYVLNSIFPNQKLKEKLSKIDYGLAHPLKNILNIKEVKIKATHIKYGKKFMKILAIDQFPIRSNLAWLSPIFNIPETTIFYRLEGLTQTRANELLDKAHQEMRLRGIGTNVTKLSENSNQAIYMSAMEELAEKVQGSGERLFNTQLYAIVYGNNHRDLHQAEKKFIGEANRNKMKVDRLSFKQLSAFLSLSLNGDMDNFYTRNTLEVGSSAIGQSWPFISESFNDKTGFYIGATQSNKPVFIDWEYRDSSKNRNQSNSIIFGATGKGKSTFVKKILKDEFARGIKTYVIDPENEYETLCKNLGGTYIDLSGQKNSKGVIERLNPLQPFATGEGNRNPMDNHFKFLESFFKSLIYPSVNDVVLQMSYLKFAIAKLYESMKIKPNDEAKKWPTLTDLYSYLLKLSKSKKKNDHFEKVNIFKELGERLYDLTNKGSDGNLWDGTTTLNIKNDEMVVFNIQELYSSGNKRLVNSQMFLMLNYLTYLVERNKRENEKREKKVNISITIDEAHLLVNKDNPTTLSFAYNMYKRIRKYFGWMRLVTQNIADFTGSEEIKRETSGILNSAQFMFIFGLNPKDINDLDNLLSESGGLTNYEKAFLNIGETHSVIFLSGSQYRSTILLDYTDEEKEVWGWKN